VRRTGGDSGAVSVAYRTEPGDGIAQEGADYEEVSGRLHWDDGDVGERTIQVPIRADDGTPEGYEDFRLALSDTDGGAGLGTRNAWVTIQPDGAPAGQFALEVWETYVAEAGILEFWLRRDYYDEGSVCVTLETKSRSATAGEDFIADPEQYCWDDQDWEPKLVSIDIVNDQDEEGEESFDIKLSNPTGGAIVGPSGSATIAIAASDTPFDPPPSRGGGGSTGLLSLLLLGLGVLLRTGRSCLRIRE
jgi:Calx-beta domain